MAYDPNNVDPYHQGQIGPSSVNRTALGMSEQIRIRPGNTLEVEVCKRHGRTHVYGSQVLDVNTVLLVCECGDTLWKERPKNA